MSWNSNWLNWLKFFNILYMFIRYFRIYQSLILCIDHLYTFILKVFNKLVLSNPFHVCGAGIIDNVMAPWKKINKLLACALSNCFRFMSIFWGKINLFSFYVIAVLNLIVCLISEAKYGDRSEKNEVEAIRDLIFEFLKLLFSNLDSYSIQIRIYSRSISIRFV